MKNENETSHFFYMYKRLFLCIFTNKIFIIIFSFLEFFDIFCYTIALIPNFFQLNNPSFNIYNIPIADFLLFISPYNKISDLLMENNSNVRKLPNIIIIFVYFFLWIIFYITLYSIGDFDYNKESIIHKVKSIILINFYSYFFMRLIGIYGIHCVISLFFSIILKNTYTIIDILLLFILILLAIGDSLGKYIFFTQFSVLLKFKFHECAINRYPFDTFLAEQYDKMFIFIKILISMENSYFMQNNGEINTLLIFIDFLIIFGLFSIGIYIFYLFFIDKDTLIYISLNDLTLFRILFINQICISIILYFLFYDEGGYIIFTSLSIIYFIVQFIILIKHFENYVISQAILSKNILGVCWFFQTNKIDQGTFITAWVVNHKVNCDKENCEICKELNKKEYDENFEGLDNYSPKQNKLKITRILSKKLNLNENNCLIESYNINSIMKAYPPFNFICKLSSIAYKEKHKYGPEDILRLDFIYLTVLFLSDNNQQFRFFRKIFLLSKKYKTQERIVSMLKTITELVKNSHKDMIDRYELIKKNEDLKNDMFEYIKDFQNFLYFEIKTPENYLNIAHKFDKIKKHKNIESIIRKNNDYDYKMLQLRFIYETLINNKIKNSNEFDINYYNDFLNFHYIHDRLLYLNFSIERRIFTIINGSKELLKYSGKDFEIIFPNFFKSYAINMCLDKLKNSDITDKKNYIELICKDLSLNETLGYIFPIKIEFSVYPTIKIDELLISMNYRTDYTNILIFRTTNNNSEHLFSLSSKLFNYFGVTPEILLILEKSGFYINYSKLFTFQNYYDNSNIILCSFNQNKYLRYYKKLMKTEGLCECSNYDELKEFHNKFYNKNNEEIKFQIQKKFICEDSENLYLIYHIKEFKNKKQDENSDINEKSIISEYNPTVTKMDNFEDENKNNDSQKRTILKTLNIGGTLSFFSQASMNSPSINKKNISPIKGFVINKIEEKKKRNKQIQIFIFSILIYGFFLMILTLIFLIIVLHENHIFKNLFQLFQSFTIFQNSIESIPLMILSNFCYHKKNNECINYYKYYSNYMQNIHISLKNVTLINEVIQIDLPGRFEIAMNSFVEFIDKLFQIKTKEISQISKFTINKFKLLIYNNNIFIERTDIIFMDLVREFNNWLSLSIYNNDYLNETFALLNFWKNDKDYLLITSDNNTDITQIRKNMYLILLNLPLIHNGMETSCNIIQEGFQNSLKLIKNYLLGFFLGLTFLHFLLLFICHFLLIFFLQMLKVLIQPMNHELSNLDYYKFIENRFSKLKELCLLYQNNPNNLINNIIISEREYKKELRKRNQVLKSSKESDEKDIKSIQFKNKEHSLNFPDLKDSHFMKLISKQRVYIILLFILYSIYSVIFFILTDEGKTRLSYLVEYSKINQKLDSYTYDNFNTLIYIMLTNSTKYSLGERILRKTNFDYLYDGFDNLHDIIRKKETIEVVHKKSFPPINTIIDLNCAHGKIPNLLFANALKEKGKDFDLFIKNLCESFPITTIGDDTMLIKNIIYLLNQIYNKYYPGSFEEIHNQINNTYLFDQFTIVLVVNRLIRYYFNDNLFRKEIDNEFTYFYNLIIPYLILNMVIEIAIFWILNIFVISKIKLKHKRIIEFITSLRM